MQFIAMRIVTEATPHSLKIFKRLPAKGKSLDCRQSKTFLPPTSTNLQPTPRTPTIFIRKMIWLSTVELANIKCLKGAFP